MKTSLAGKQGFIGVRGAGSAGRSGEAGRAEQADMGDSCVGTMMALAAAAHLTPKYELLARSGPAGLLFDKLDDDLKNPAAAAVSAGGAAPPKSFATIHPPITPPITPAIVFPAGPGLYCLAAAPVALPPIAPAMTSMMIVMMSMSTCSCCGCR
jgi:hypothetical protein